MATSPRMRWPYPNEGSDPWYDAFEDFVGAQDASTYATNEAKNIILAGGGVFTWDAPTSTLTWDAAILLNSSGSGFTESVAAAPVGITVAEGDLCYVSFVSSPTENTVLSIQSGSFLPPSDPDRTFVLWRRENDRIFFRNGAVLEDGESAAVIDDGPGAGADQIYFQLRGVQFGYTNALNFTGPVPVAGTSGGGTSTIELQLAADSVQVTVNPYTLDTDYRAFYVNRVTPTVFNLVQASTLAGQYVLVKTLTGNAVAITADAGDTIEGAAAVNLTSQYDSVLLHSASLDGGATYDWYIAARNNLSGGGSSSATFTLPTVEMISAGNFVAVDGSGNAVIADSTAVGRYPAVGVCTGVLGATVTIQPTGPATVFVGLTPGTTYYLDTSGGLAVVPPMGALVSQAVVQAYSASSGILLTSSPVVYA